MASFKIKDSNLFPVPGNTHMIHLATISYGLREFIVMWFVARNTTYIEEIVLESKDWSKDVFANCKFIKDDNLASDLAAFAKDRGILNLKSTAETILDSGRGKMIEEALAAAQQISLAFRMAGKPDFDKAKK